MIGRYGVIAIFWLNHWGDIPFSTSCSAFAITHYIQAETCQGKCAQQAEGIHIAENIDVACNHQEYDDRNTGRQGNRVMWGATKTITLEYESWKEFHTREGHKDMIGTDNRGVAGKH